MTKEEIFEYIRENLKNLEGRPYDVHTKENISHLENYLKNIFKYTSFFTAGQLRERGVYIPEYIDDQTTMYPVGTDVSEDKSDPLKISLDMYFTFDEEVYKIENSINEVLNEIDIPEIVTERFKRNVMMRVMQKFKGFANPSKVAESINKRFEKES